MREPPWSRLLFATRLGLLPVRPQPAILVGITQLFAPARLAGESLLLVSPAELRVRRAPGQIGEATAALAAQAIVYSKMPSTGSQHDACPINLYEYSKSNRTGN